MVVVVTGLNCVQGPGCDTGMPFGGILMIYLCCYIVYDVVVGVLSCCCYWFEVCVQGPGCDTGMPFGGLS